MKIKLSLAIFFLSTCLLQGYIYQAVVLKKWQPDTRRFQYFIGLGDFHNKTHPANVDHVAQIKALLSKASHHRLKVFTEDLSVVNNLGRLSSHGFCVNSRGGVLGGLTDTCRELGIETANLEYRYARVCALGPVLNNIMCNPHDFISTQQINIADLTHEIYNELHVLPINQHSRLAPWYKAQSKMIERKMEQLDWPRQQDASVAEYLLERQQSMQPLVNQLLTFDAGLFDMKLVHEIDQQQHADRLCAIAGGSHIERTSKALKKIGYKAVLETKPTFQRATAVDVGGPQLHKEHPQPIMLDRLQKFF